MSTLTTAPPPTRVCPACSHVSKIATDECPACGVVISKVHHTEELASSVAKPAPVTAPSGLMAHTDRLLVKQVVEQLEMWTDFMVAKQYVVKDGSEVLFHAAEESGSGGQLLGRTFLNESRSFTIHINTVNLTPALIVKSPFRLMLHEASVHDSWGVQLGTVQRQFSWRDKRYLLRGIHDPAAYEIVGPMRRPRAFDILLEGRKCGRIADHRAGQFGVELPPGVSPELKAVFLGAVFLIDFAHFENRR